MTEERRYLYEMLTAPGVPHMRLLWYVDEKGGEVGFTDEGYTDLVGVFERRPEEYRYAIVHVCPDEYWVIDMYKLRHNDIWTTLSLGEHRVYKSVEAALMAAHLRG